ncbi:MAG TPA: chemotaxis protein CheW [Polyangiales bacterium]|nr:chemotaxis protein CheW [Polyangiales bacterium]
MGDTQFCTFMVDDLLFGVEVTQVQEVLRAQPMTRVPLAADVISGLINLRGQIVTAIDLRACLGLPPRADAEERMNVVIRGADGGVSFLVDTIGDVLEVPSSAFEKPPSTMKAGLARMVDAVCKLPSRLLLVLAPERALHAALTSEPRPTVLH